MYKLKNLLIASLFIFIPIAPTPPTKPEPPFPPTYDESSTPSPTPFESADPGTPTPSADPGDVCANIDGIQTSVPDTYHLAGNNCLQWELGGAPSSSSAPSPNNSSQVLGVSTTRLASTGSDLALPRTIFAIITAGASFFFVKKYNI